MIDGQIWANIWGTECIARICPATGQARARRAAARRGARMRRGARQHARGWG